MSNNIALIFDFNRTIYNPDADMLTDGALSLLETLRSKEVPLFLIAKGGEERKALINKLQLEDFFEHMIVQEEKAQESFEICRALLPEAHMFAVGDRIREEITYANACGITTIWFKNGKFSSEEPEHPHEKPKHTIHTLNELLGILFPTE